MCKAPGHLKKMLLVPVLSAGLLLSRWKSKKQSILKCPRKCKNRTGWDWCHMNCQQPQVLIRLTLTLTIPTKMIFRSLFKARYIWCLEHRSKNRRRLRLSMRRSRVRWNHLRGLVSKKKGEAGQNLHQKAKLPHSQGFIIQEALSVYGFLSTANSQEKLCHTVS